MANATVRGVRFLRPIKGANRKRLDSVRTRDVVLVSLQYFPSIEGPHSGFEQLERAGDRVHLRALRSRFVKPQNVGSLRANGSDFEWQQGEPERVGCRANCSYLNCDSD